MINSNGSLVKSSLDLSRKARLCKSTLGVKKSSTNLAVRTELGRLPLESFKKKSDFFIFSQT